MPPLTRCAAPTPNIASNWASVPLPDLSKSIAAAGMAGAGAEPWPGIMLAADVDTAYFLRFGLSNNDLLPGPANQAVSAPSNVFFSVRQSV